MTLSWKMLTTPVALAGALAALWALAPGCAPAADEPAGGGRAPAGALEAPSFEAFRASVYKEPWPGGHYVVEGDLPLRDDDELRAYYEGARLGAAALVVGTENGRDVLLSPERRVDLSYCIDQSFAPSERAATVDALRVAASRWEAAADVHFVYRPELDANCNTGNGLYFVVTKVANSVDAYSAKAFFPNFDQPDHKLNIDALAFDPQKASILDDVMTHEFGHILGFRHEHARNESPQLNRNLCVENNEGWRAFTPHDGGSVMAYDECITGDPSDFKMSPADEQGALAVYGAPGRFQRVDGPQVAYRSPMRLNTGLTQLEIPALRARAGSTFVAVLRGQSVNDSVNLYVRLDRKAEVTQPDGCKAELTTPGVPQVCRLEIPRDRDALVHVGVKTGGASINVDGALSIIFVQAP